TTHRRPPTLLRARPAPTPPRTARSPTARSARARRAKRRRRRRARAAAARRPRHQVGSRDRPSPQDGNPYPPGSRGQAAALASARRGRLASPAMIPDLEDVVERYHRALALFVTGDSSAQETLFSRQDDVSLANPLGPPARGWPEVSDRLRGAAAQLHDGES